VNTAVGNFIIQTEQGGIVTLTDIKSVSPSPRLLRPTSLWILKSQLFTSRGPEFPNRLSWHKTVCSSPSDISKHSSKRYAREKIDRRSDKAETNVSTWEFRCLGMHCQVIITSTTKHKENYLHKARRQRRWVEVYCSRWESAISDLFRRKFWWWFLGGIRKWRKWSAGFSLGVGLYLIHHLKGDTGGDEYLLRWICCHGGRTLTGLFMVADENWTKIWAKIWAKIISGHADRFWFADRESHLTMNNVRFLE